eukprot:TRINITY_DN93160_c0_g1_i1.p1 TRINITY_DN93160_c0_g1~~TRINITY_DN93160_c0_g1_i1.p1  ORF type:complete len:485 (+),score=62.60 TRINITY_DN93160_c0_g1_i1:71-1456(+)
MADPAGTVDIEIAVVPSKLDTEAAVTTKQTQDAPEGTSASDGSSYGLLRHGGTLPTAMCLTKAAIGAGVLSIAGHAAEVGFGYTLGCLVVGGILTVLGIRMITEASISTSSWSFEDICDDLFHPSMAIWTGFINVCNCLGAAAAYLIVCGQVFQVVADTSDSTRNLFITLIGIFVCGPLALAPHVSWMRYLAMGSVAGICLLCVTVVVSLAEHGMDPSVDVQTVWVGRGTANVLTYMNAINIVVFAYNNQFNVPQLTGELTPKPETRRMTIVSMISTAICFVLYGLVSLFDVMAFGLAENQKDSLVLDLFPDRHKPLVLVTLLAVMFSVLTCFQFHIYPIRQFLAYCIRKSRGRGKNQEASDTIYCGTSLTRIMDIICALAAVIVAVTIAVLVPQLRTILDFVGAFAGAWISFVIPPLFIIQIRRRVGGFSWRRPEIMLCLAFFLLGVFLFVFGTYSAVVG